MKNDINEIMNSMSGLLKNAEGSELKLRDSVMDKFDVSQEDLIQLSDKVDLFYQTYKDRLDPSARAACIDVQRAADDVQRAIDTLKSLI